MLNRASRFAANNAIALAALFLALGGASYAATGAFEAAGGQLTACVGESHVVVLKTGHKPCAKGKKTVVWNQQGPVGAKGAAGAPGSAGSAGSPGANGFSALSTLPSGASESGDFNIGNENGKVFEGDSYGYSIPLAAPLDISHSIYVTTGSAPGCPGVGQAARGFLCVYSSEREGINPAETVIFNFESGKNAKGSGRFGFDVEWAVTEPQFFDVGTWTVTAP